MFEIIVTDKGSTLEENFQVATMKGLDSLKKVVSESLTTSYNFSSEDDLKREVANYIDNNVTCTVDQRDGIPLIIWFDPLTQTHVTIKYK